MKFSIFLLILSFLLFQTLFAQKNELSLRMCIERAQKNSFLIQAMEKKTEAAQKKYQFEHSQALPQIQADFAAAHFQLEPYSFNQNSVLANADWALGDFLLNTAQAAKQEELIAQSDMRQHRLDVGLRCAMLYIHILQQRQHQELLQQRLKLLDAHYHVAKALWQSGNRTQFDLLQTEAEILRLKENVALLELELRNLLQELAQLINEKFDENIELQPLDVESICNQPLPESSIEAIQHLPVIESFDLHIKARQFQTRAVKAQQLPHLNLSGGFMQDGDPTADGNYWLMSAGISMPLFRWNAAKFQKQESEALGQELNFQKQETERNISIIINQIRQKLAKLKEVIQLQQQRLKTTENVFKIAEANYEAGLMTNLEYLSTQEQFTETHIAIQGTQLDYVSVLVQFYAVTNQLNKIDNF